MILLPGDVLKVQRSVIPSVGGSDRIPAQGMISHTSAHE
jgi:hypothetical protein